MFLIAVAGEGGVILWSALSPHALPAWLLLCCLGRVVGVQSYKSCPNTNY